MLSIANNRGSGRIAHLARAIHSGRSKYRFMLGLSAYFDESGHSEDGRCRFVGMGGLCAPSSAWEDFHVKWQSILDEYCAGKPFHAKNFAHHAEPFNGWDEKKRRKFFGSLVNAIRESGARPVASAVSLEAYESICQGIPTAKKILNDPYYLCFQDVTRAAAVSVIGYSIENRKNIEEFQDNERVAMVYAHQEQFGAISSPEGTGSKNMGRAESLWHAIRDAHPHFGRWMGSYSSDSPNNLTFLQAADLFAYEFTHEFENRVNRPQDPMRWGLSQLLPDWPQQNFLHKFYGVPQLLELLIESGFLGPHEDTRNGVSIESSMSSIMLRDLLFGRKHDRNKNDDR